MVRTQGRFTIAALAREAGVGVETVRYYQRRGLLRVPDRVETGGHGDQVRRYGNADMQALRFIRSAQAAGFKLDEIAELLLLDAQDDRPRARQLAAARIEALDTQIAALTTARQALARLEQACCATSSGPCPILTAFNHTG